MARSQAEVVPNQVFIGCPWKTIRPKYEQAIEVLKRKYPLSFIIIGRDDEQAAEELLEIIKSKLETSKNAIFDATGGNANVSLEYGYAEARGIDRAIYMNTRQPPKKKQSKERPIIADLAGKRINHYKHQDALVALLSTMAKNHSYTKRLEKALSKGASRLSGGQKRRRRALALKIIHQMDWKGTKRRDDIVQQLLTQAYSRDEIDQMIRHLHAHDLVSSLQGPHSTVTIT